MITALETSNFRLLRANRVSLANFAVLVGPNASGKTTFLDALQFVADVLDVGVSEAVARRTPNFFDLCYQPSQPIAIATEVDMGDNEADSGAFGPKMRHEIEIGLGETGGLQVSRENLFILPGQEAPVLLEESLFGNDWPGKVIHVSPPKQWRKVASKTKEGRDYFRDEKTAWNNTFRFGEDRSVLGSLPEDPERFPLALQLKSFLRQGVRRLALEPRRLQAPSPPSGKPTLGLDGSNLPHVIKELQDRDSVLFNAWKAHLATAVQGLLDVSVTTREEDKYLVLKARFAGSHQDPIPSWLLSDGTLRMMAITALSYAAQRGTHHVYLIEEPENGLHPLAVQAVFETISTPSAGLQWLCATHSPVFLAHVTLDDTLVFRRHPEGWSIVRRGPEVAELSRWAGKANLAGLLATGVLS